MRTTSNSSLYYLCDTQQNNPYSNTYNPGWRNHPNSSWNNNQGSSLASKSNFPLGFPSRAPMPEKKPLMEDMFMQYMTKIDAFIQSQTTSIRNLEAQVGQLANALNNKPHGTLPSDNEPNSKTEGKEHYKVINLRNGKKVS
ncbi:Uncharacterized protein TCM_027580 [Theobroma cacao]|uniref:Uncharacterized protein n=1 Tax=Theobroma cacao TaxID=3641 RepID=A0A061G9E9_THECC|nr:Uncharacterized protein TCM_027580 [Theobroma cacao]